MYITKYLVINSRGNVTIKEREPKLDGNEISLKISLEVPNSLFERPRLEASMKIPTEAVPKTKITPAITDNLEKIIKTSTGLTMSVKVVEHDDQAPTAEPSNKSRRKVDAPVEEVGEFTDFQIFRKGDKVKFYITNPKNKYAGVHTVTAVQKVEVGHIIQTDKSKGNWIHVHWFAPATK